jgi:hypothetical protein
MKRSAIAFILLGLLAGFAHAGTENDDVDVTIFPSLKVEKDIPASSLFQNGVLHDHTFEYDKRSAYCQFLRQTHDNTTSLARAQSWN